MLAHRYARPVERTINPSDKDSITMSQSWLNQEFHRPADVEHHHYYRLPQPFDRIEDAAEVARECDSLRCRSHLFPGQIVRARTARVNLHLDVAGMTCFNCDIERVARAPTSPSS